MKYDKTWRRARKTITDFLVDKEVEKLVPIQDAESTQMIWEVLHGPEKYHSHVLRQFGAVILASVYGQRGKAPLTQRFFAIQAESAALLDQGATPPLDVFPILMYVPDWMTPWRGWKRRADESKRKQRELYRELFQEAKGRTGGMGQEIFVKKLLDEKEKQGYSEIELEYLSGFLLEGGADTTAMAFLTFIVAMATNPNLQQQAQAEVDSAFGEGIVPVNLESKELPFLQACFWEVRSLPLTSANFGNGRYLTWIDSTVASGLTNGHSTRYQ